MNVQGQHRQVHEVRVGQSRSVSTTWLKDMVSIGEWPIRQIAVLSDEVI